MLILLPPSETKTDRTRGRPADPSRLSFPQLRRTRAPVAARPRRGQRRPDAPARARRQPPTSPTRSPATPGSPPPPRSPPRELYTGVLYDALDLASLDPAARRRANRWLVVVSALYGAAAPGRPDRRRTGCRWASTLPGLGPLASLWRRRSPRCSPPSPAAASWSTAGPARTPPRGAPGPLAAALGAGPRARRHPHGQAHPRPGGAAPVQVGVDARRCPPCATWWPGLRRLADDRRERPGSPGSSTRCPR